MESPLNVLHLEDDANDAELIRSILEAEGIELEVRRVETRQHFVAAVEEGGFDIIFADYQLPSFDGMSALGIAQEKCPDIPIIIISGVMGEERAIESLKSGATDYVLKQNLSRLVPSVERALREAQKRKELKQAQAKAALQLEHLRSLRRIDTAISGTLDLRVTLNAILDEVLGQLDIDAADILLYNPHAHTLNFAGGRGFRTEALKHTSLRLGKGYAGRAALDRRVIRETELPGSDSAAHAFEKSPLFGEEGFISYFGVPLEAKGNLKGVLEIFHRSRLDPDNDWIEFLETLAGQAAIAIEDARMFLDIQRSHDELNVSYDATLEGWVKALDIRDKETEGHTQRVTELTVKLAERMGSGDEELSFIRRGALLHDIGKLGIPDAVLLKPGKLTEEEWVVMRKHPVYAFEWLSPIKYLRPAIDIPYCHHEKWDGTGYPRGLKGEEIPFSARLFTVVDIWDALRSDRPYREAWPEAKVREHIASQVLTHLDPSVVEEFFRLEL